MWKSFLVDCEIDHIHSNTGISHLSICLQPCHLQPSCFSLNTFLLFKKNYMIDNIFNLVTRLCSSSILIIEHVIIVRSVTFSHCCNICGDINCFMFRCIILFNILCKVWERFVSFCHFVDFFFSLDSRTLSRIRSQKLIS